MLNVSTACGSGRVLAALATRPLPQAVLTVHAIVTRSKALK
jgi:hypothetical protein